MAKSKKKNRKIKELKTEKENRYGNWSVIESLILLFYILQLILYLFYFGKKI